MLVAYWTSQAVHGVAKRGVADLVKDGPKSADELAKATKTHSRSLYRVLRALASVGIFAEDDRGRFGLTDVARCLLDEHGSQRAVAIMMGEEHYASWAHLLYSVQTGKPAFDYLSEHSGQAKRSDAAMPGFHGEETPTMIEAYDFSQFKAVVHVGGGNGTVISAILRKHPGVNGILFDLEGVIGRAKEN